MKNFYYCTKKEQIERWENVLRVLRGLSRHERKMHFDMSQFGIKTDCGSVACAVGHCSMDPWFRRRGWKGKYVPEQDFLGKTEYVLKYDNGQEGGSWMAIWVVDFFGPSENEGDDQIFLNEEPRSVGQVIREVRARIREMKSK